MEVTKLWLDGCFDGFHYAHANAVRQASKLQSGPVEVVVGVHSDDEIGRHKGPPLFDEKERYALVRSCRWVSRVEEGVPYVTQPDVFERYNVDLIVHGDDPATDAEGNDCYAIPKALGKYREVKRTEGISTTSLIERVLHPERLSGLHEVDDTRLQQLLTIFSESCVPPLPVVNLRSPSADVKRLFPEAEGLISIYIDGDWDCFCAGHVEILRRAKAAVRETAGVPDASVKLVVGVDDDQVAGARLGESSLYAQYERALDIAQCRYVDVILVKSGRDISSDVLLSFGVQMIVEWDAQKRQIMLKGSRQDDKYMPPVHIDGEQLRFYTPSELRNRLQSNLAAYKARQSRKLNT